MHNHLLVITANILKTLSVRRARRALLDLLAARPDFGGLEEWLAERDRVLDELGVLIRFPKLRRRPRPVEGYVFVRPLRGGPVGFYDASRFDLVRLRSRLLAHGPRPTWGTEMLLKDRASNLKVPVLLIHLLAHHDDPAYRIAWEQGREAACVWAEGWAGYPAFVLGDTNKHLMDLPPLASCWDGHRPLPTGPHGGTIDTVFHNTRALEVHTLQTGSDHKAVAVRYPALAGVTA